MIIELDLGDYAGVYACLYEYWGNIASIPSQVCTVTVSGPYWYAQSDFYHTLFC